MIPHEWIGTGNQLCKHCRVHANDATTPECKEAPLQKSNRFENGKWIDEKKRVPYDRYGNWPKYLETWEREFVEEARHLQQVVKDYNAEVRRIKQRGASRAKYGYKPKTHDYEKAIAAEGDLTPP